MEYNANAGDVINLPWGRVILENNEVFIETDPSHDDPPGISLLANGPGRSLGKISFKTTKGGTLEPLRAVELVLIQGKRRYDDINDLTGELYVGINNGGDGDANMVDVALIHHDGIECRVPIAAPGFSAAVPAPSSTAAPAAFPNKLVSPDGRVELDIQNADALNMTLYEDGQALWSVLTGTTEAGHARGLRP